MVDGSAEGSGTYLGGAGDAPATPGPPGPSNPPHSPGPPYLIGPGSYPAFGYVPGHYPAFGYVPGYFPGLPHQVGYPYPPYAGWPYPLAVPWAAPTGPSINGVALAALICGCAGFLYLVPAIVAVVLGFVARHQIKESNGRETGAGMALGGIIAGFAWIALVIVGIVLVVALAPSHSSRGTIDLFL